MSIHELPFIMYKCLLCTILIEVVVAKILKVKEKQDFLNIILVNIITNPIVVTMPIFVYLLYGYKYEIITLYMLEIFTVFIEGFIYKKVLNYKKINLYLLSFILNMFSYLLGLIINMF